MITDAFDSFAVVLKVDNRVSLIKSFFAHLFCGRLLGSAPKGQID